MTCAARAGLRRLPLLGDILPANHHMAQRANRREPWLVQDVAASSDVSDSDPHRKPTAMLCLPLVIEDNVLGLLLVLAPRGHIFGLDEIALGASMADQIATGLQAAQLRERTTILEERERIARDLHDSAIQALYGLVTLTGAASLQLDQHDRDAARHTLGRIGDTGRQAIREIRLFIHNLNPPALVREGLIGALHQRLATVEGHADIEARLLADDTLNLPLRTQRYLYQIAQEALNNTLKHAHATRVTVYLSTESDTIVLEILDDGIGFDALHLLDAPHGGMGLRNMQQRSSEFGAGFRITSQPGHGTRVRVTHTPDQQPP
jgi:signal transduction histidine kinase